ncbi:DUF2742 domain-containing protein [Mycobacterium colombiense]
MSFEDGPPGPRNGESRDTQFPALAPQQSQANDYRQSSRQVAWFEVALWRDRMLERLGVQNFPMVGTPAWCALPDDHPVKLAAASDAAQHWALRVDTAQEAQAAASQAISGAEDWSAIAKANRGRAEFAAANPWARRVVYDGSGTAKLATDAENDAENTTDNATDNTALGTDAENTAKNSTENSTLAEGTIDFGAANPWAKRVRAA